MLELLLVTSATLPVLIIFSSFIPLLLHYEKKWELNQSRWKEVFTLSLLIWISSCLTGGVPKELMERGMSNLALFKITIVLFMALPSLVTVLFCIKLFKILPLITRSLIASIVCLITHPILGAAVVLKYVAMHQGSASNFWELQKLVSNPLWMAWRPNWLDIIIWLLLASIIFSVKWAGDIKNKRLIPLILSFAGVLFILFMILM